MQRCEYAKGSILLSTPLLVLVVRALFVEENEKMGHTKIFRHRGKSHTAGVLLLVIQATATYSSTTSIVRLEGVAYANLETEKPEF